jgi:hypothetical protein
MIYLICEVAILPLLDELSHFKHSSGEQDFYGSIRKLIAEANIGRSKMKASCPSTCQMIKVIKGKALLLKAGALLDVCVF